MIAQTLQQKIGEALKAHDVIRLSTLRLLLSAFNYERIDKQHELTDEEEIEVIRREAKKRKDAIEIYKKVNELERADKETKELEILNSFLPPEMTDAELETIVTLAIQESGASSATDMGRVMGAVMQKVGSKVDGKRVSEMVKTKLQ